MKQDSINIIEALYPSDSQFSETNSIGKRFMLESIEESNFNWRDLPANVLSKWAEKCQAKEAADDRRMKEKYS